MAGTHLSRVTNLSGMQNMTEQSPYQDGQTNKVVWSNEYQNYPWTLPQQEASTIHVWGCESACLENSLSIPCIEILLPGP